MIEDRDYSTWCRHLRCNRLAEYHVKVHNVRVRGEKYDGDFCRKHLVRMLPIKVFGMGPNDTLVINKKVRW